MFIIIEIIFVSEMDNLAVDYNVVTTIGESILILFYNFYYSIINITNIISIA